MINNKLIYTYINKYLNNMKNNSNAMDKSIRAVITGITYAIYTKFQKYISYRREDHADPPALPKTPTSHIS
jgi:hypothetical protein